ncbi:hypothetical protein KGO95_01660 [Patescibacteria group bacterium]|nr:hypothetical protein [Patescibacteria group bacterium]
MIISLYGPDSYRRQKKQDDILAGYRAKHSGLSVEYFDLEDDNAFDALREFVRATSLFDAMKCAVVRHADALGKAEGKEFRAFLKDQLARKESTLVLLWDKKPTKEYAFLLKAPALAQEFAELSGSAQLAFIANEAKARGITIDRAGIDLLSRAFQGNTWGLVTELEKLALLDEKTVTLKTISGHLELFNELNLFTALGTIRTSPDRAERLRLLEELLSRHNDPAMLFNMIAVAPYEGREWKTAVADYDVAVKSGKLEYEEALLALALR